MAGQGKAKKAKKTKARKSNKPISYTAVREAIEDAIADVAYEQEEDYFVKMYEENEEYRKRQEADLVAEFLKREDEILAKYLVEEAFAFDRLMAELEELLSC